MCHLGGWPADEACITASLTPCMDLTISQNPILSQHTRLGAARPHTDPEPSLTYDSSHACNFSETSLQTLHGCKGRGKGEQDACSLPVQPRTGHACTAAGALPPACARPASGASCQPPSAPADPAHCSPNMRATPILGSAYPVASLRPGLLSLFCCRVHNRLLCTSCGASGSKVAALLIHGQPIWCVSDMKARIPPSRNTPRRDVMTDQVFIMCILTCKATPHRLSLNWS